MFSIDSVNQIDWSLGLYTYTDLEFLPLGHLYYINVKNKSEFIEYIYIQNSFMKRFLSKF